MLHRCDQCWCITGDPPGTPCQHRCGHLDCTGTTQPNCRVCGEPHIPNGTIIGTLKWAQISYDCTVDSRRRIKTDE